MIPLADIPQKFSREILETPQDRSRTYGWKLTSTLDVIMSALDDIEKDSKLYVYPDLKLRAIRRTPNEENWEVIDTNILSPDSTDYYSDGNGSSRQTAGEISFTINEPEFDQGPSIYVEWLGVGEDYRKTNSFMLLVSTLLPYRQQGYKITADYDNKQLGNLMNRWLQRHSSNLETRLMRQDFMGEGESFLYNLYDGDTVIGGIMFTLYLPGDGPYGKEEGRGPYIHVNAINVEERYRTTDAFMKLVSLLIPYRQQGYEIGAAYANPRLQQVINQWLERHSKSGWKTSIEYSDDYRVPVLLNKETGEWAVGRPRDSHKDIRGPLGDELRLWLSGGDKAGGDLVQEQFNVIDGEGIFSFILPDYWIMSQKPNLMSDITQAALQVIQESGEKMPPVTQQYDVRNQKTSMGLRGDLPPGIEFRIGEYVDDGKECSAWLDGKLIGTLQIDKWGMIQGVDVIPEYRRMGVATAMCDYLLDNGYNVEHDWEYISDEGRDWATHEEHRWGSKVSMGLRGDLPEGIKFHIEEIEPGEMTDEMETGGIQCTAWLGEDEIGSLTIDSEGKIFWVYVLERFSRRGVATAMKRTLEHAGYEVHHDWRNLSPDAEGWAATGAFDKEAAPWLTLEPVETGGIYFDYTGSISTKIPDDAHMPGVTEEIWNVCHHRKIVGSIVIEHKPQGSRVEEMFILPDYRNTNAMMLLATPVIKLRNEGQHLFYPDFENERLQQIYDKRYSGWKYSMPNFTLEQVKPGETYLNHNGTRCGLAYDRAGQQQEVWNLLDSEMIVGSIYLIKEEKSVIPYELYVRPEYRRTNAMSLLITPLQQAMRDGYEMLKPPIVNDRLNDIYDRRYSMALPPDVLKRYPYFYHVTDRANLESIRKNGIWPASILGDSRDEGFWKPRPNHTYLFTDADQAYESGRYQDPDIKPVVLSINTKYLDPKYLKADEDYLMGVYHQPEDFFGDLNEDDLYDENAPHYNYPEYGLPPHAWGWSDKDSPTLGDWAQERGLDSEEITQDSMNRFHRLAYEGPIPPEAIGIRGDWDQNGWPKSKPLPAPSKPLPHPNQLQIETATIELPPETADNGVMRTGQPVLFYPNLDLLAVGAPGSSQHSTVEQELKRQGIIPSDQPYGSLQEDLYPEDDTSYGIPAHWGISMEHDLTDPQVQRMVQLMKEYRDLPVYQATKQVVASLKDLKRI